MCAKMKLNNVEKLVPNLYYKRKYIMHIRALKQALDHGFVLERIHRCIEFNPILDGGGKKAPTLTLNRNKIMKRNLS